MVVQFRYMRKAKLPNKKGKQSQRKEIIKKTRKKKYKACNWKEYNESLVRRGSLDFWVEKGIIKSWKVDIVDSITKKKKRGPQEKYADKAIELCRLVGKVFHQRLRQTEGFVRCIFKQTNVSVRVPDYSTLSRRGGTITVNLPRQEKETIVAIVDSTGMKVYGEGE